jgi:hypothetical protein
MLAQPDFRNETNRIPKPETSSCLSSTAERNYLVLRSINKNSFFESVANNEPEQN